MPSLNLITTTAGRAAILGAVAAPSTIVVDDVQLSSVNQAVGIGTTSLSTVVATLTAVGSVRTAGAGHAMHLVVVDDSAAAYSVRALAVRLDDGTFLMVYSQAAVIATKATDSSLHLAFDLTIDADTAATLDFGDTDYALPAATESTAGVLELATATELDGGTDITRAITPAEFTRRTSFLLGGLSVMNRIQRTAAGSPVNFYGVCYASDLALFVVVGDDGAIQTSPSCYIWSARTPAASFAGTFRSVASNGAGLVVAVGTSGTIQSSVNAINWTARTPAGGYTGTFRCVTYVPSLGLWVAVGANGAIQTSTNGTTWTARTAAGGYTGTFHSIAFGNGLLVAVGDNGQIQTSTNGTTWTARTSGSAKHLRAVAYGPLGFVVVGNDENISISATGITWTSSSSTASTPDNVGLCYAAGCFVGALGDEGVAWVLDSRGVARKTAKRTDITTGPLAVCFAQNSFVFVGQDGAIEQAFI